MERINFASAASLKRLMNGSIFHAQAFSGLWNETSQRDLRNNGTAREGGNPQIG